MKLVEALQVLIYLTDILKNLTIQIETVTSIIQKAQSEDRDLTDEEWSMLDKEKEAAFQRFAEAIKKKEALKETNE